MNVKDAAVAKFFIAWYLFICIECLCLCFSHWYAAVCHVEIWWMKQRSFTSGQSYAARCRVLEPKRDSVWCLCVFSVFRPKILQSNWSSKYIIMSVHSFAESVFACHNMFVIFLWSLVQLLSDTGMGFRCQRGSVGYRRIWQPAVTHRRCWEVWSQNQRVELSSCELCCPLIKHFTNVSGQKGHWSKQHVCLKYFFSMLV